MLESQIFSMCLVTKFIYVYKENQEFNFILIVFVLLLIDSTDNTNI